MSSTFIIGDCLECMKDIENESINLIYINPPFAITAKEWDKPLRWDLIFPEMFRILKSNGVICIHSSIPFTYELIKHHQPKYNYNWCKVRPTGFLNAKKQPLRNMEEILVYYKSPKHTYNIQMKGNKITKSKRENKNHTNYYQTQKAYETEHKGNYPTTFLGTFKNISQWNTPKSIPDEITKYIMLTYSNKDETILDFTCCDKNNAIIAENLGRHYLGIDINDNYINCKNT